MGGRVGWEGLELGLDLDFDIDLGLPWVLV